jgi:hypothetical protein
VRVYGPSRLCFEPLIKLLNSDLNADPKLAFHSVADPDPDPAFKNDANSCGSGSIYIVSLKYFCSWP